MSLLTYMKALRRKRERERERETAALAGPMR